jgi:RNA-binding protein
MDQIAGHCCRPIADTGQADIAARTFQKEDSMELTGRQIRQLRSLANRLEATVGIGKAGITDAVVRQMDNALEAHELVKCSVQGSAGMDTREAAIALSRPTQSAVVQVIGHRFVLYRETHRDDVEKIQLVK